MKKFMVYLDFEDDVFKEIIPAKDEEEARNYVKGNGEVILVKDVTDEFPIDLMKVSDALENANFGKYETDLIIRCLLMNKIIE